MSLLRRRLIQQLDECPIQINIAQTQDDVILRLYYDNINYISYKLHSGWNYINPFLENVNFKKTRVIEQFLMETGQEHVLDIRFRNISLINYVGIPNNNLSGFSGNKYTNIRAIYGLSKIINLAVGNGRNYIVLFANCKKLKYIDDVENLDFRNVENIKAWPYFYSWFNNTGLVRLDLSKYPPQNKLTLGGHDDSKGGCFSHNPQLQYLNITGWKVTGSMQDLFEYDYNLKSIDGIGALDTTDVTEIGAMFNRCDSLIELDISTWDMRNAKMTSIYGYRHPFGCKNLQTLRLGENFFNSPTNINLQGLPAWGHDSIISSLLDNSRDRYQAKGEDLATLKAKHIVTDTATETDILADGSIKNSAVLIKNIQLSKVTAEKISASEIAAIEAKGYKIIKS